MVVPVGIGNVVPTEDNYVDWVLIGIRKYFRERLPDLEVQTLSVGQVLESHFPADRIVKVGNKIIALQFKRPQVTPEGVQWELTPHQHQKISGRGWVYYCLPEFIDANLQNVALHHCRFVRGDSFVGEEMWIRQNPRLPTWGVVGEGLIITTHGVRVGEKDIQKILIDIRKNPEDSYVALDKEFKRLTTIKGKPSSWKERG